ncbi:oxidoreductase [Fistulina hepatica ATCC 64428]|uniref:Oxidoreductase n=1 Tax=Fistulina hepatica ATCC 64428 TaxID=1128425 RepID=A0A0D7AEB9_9AGAR|nr:oxidoreductase [Fistulina hepatica ATCC 64428]
MVGFFSTIRGGGDFDCDKDIPDLSGKIIFITGGNAGLGKETIIQLAEHKPAHIYMGARSKAKAEEAIADIKNTVPDAVITHIPLDLASFASIKEAAAAFTAQSTRLDILMNNAGIMAMPPGTTAEGYELQLGTNHVGHALLIHLLLPTLLSTAAQPDADVRIISVSSIAHHFAWVVGGLELDTAKLNAKNTWGRYAVSKLSNILYARELARHYPQLLSVSMHPGMIYTELYTTVSTANWFYRLAMPVSRLVFRSVPDGAKSQLWAATMSREKVHNGAFYLPVGKESTGSSYARDDELAAKLWEWTQKELTDHGFA